MASLEKAHLGFFLPKYALAGVVNPDKAFFYFFLLFFPKCIFLPKYALSKVANPRWSNKEEEKYYWLCLMLVTPDKATTTTKLLSQVFGVGYMNKSELRRIGHMDQLSPLIPIEKYAFIKTFSLYILSYHLHICFLRSPLRSFNLP